MAEHHGVMDSAGSNQLIENAVRCGAGFLLCYNAKSRSERAEQRPGDVGPVSAGFGDSYSPAVLFHLTAVTVTRVG